MIYLHDFVLVLYKPSVKSLDQAHVLHIPYNCNIRFICNTGSKVIKLLFEKVVI